MPSIIRTKFKEYRSVGAREDKTLKELYISVGAILVMRPGLVNKYFFLQALRALCDIRLQLTYDF